MVYLDKLRKAIKTTGSVLCIGLDPRPDFIPGPVKKDFDDPGQYVDYFCREIIEITSEFCCAFKPNLAFFESLGPDGLEIFHRILRHIPDDKIIIADAKRGDIGSTAEQYKVAYFDRFQADAVTLNPLMGFDTLDPFLQDSTKAVYPLVLTSNRGSTDLLLRGFEGYSSMSEYIAAGLRQKMQSSRTHIGMVVGATHSDNLEGVLAEYPGASLLIPGIGSQGGSIHELLPLLEKHQGIPVINSSRSILYAGGDKATWRDDVVSAARKHRDDLKNVSKRYI